MTSGPIEFRALGTRELRRPDGRRIDTLLSQPKRVALLAYLAAATPRGLHSRDRLVALFSPEQDQQHARQALRQALSVLRGELGTAAIVTVGDDEVGLDFSAVWCDVVAFNEAVAAGQHAEAVELYRGGFLEAFYVRDATPEFEQWIDTVRDRLKRDFSACARTLVDQHQASGDLAAATIWARRARQLAPDDEVLLRRLIELLDKRGDRAGALRVYEEFAEWLEREYGSKPAPETQALIEAVRARASVMPPVPDEGAYRKQEPPVPPVPIPPPPRLTRAALAVGVLVVSIGVVFWIGPWGRDRPSCVRIDSFTVEDASLPRWLGDSLGHRLAQQLSGFPDFVVRAPGQRCPIRSRVAWHVAGTATGDPRLVVEARLSGAPPAGARGEVTQWHVVVDSVAGQLVVQLYRSPVDSLLPAAVLPRTPEGLGAFLKAEQLFAEARWGAAAQQYALAQAVDPTCYLCSWRLSEVGRWFLANSDPTRRPAYLDHVDAFPARYRSLIRAAHAPLRAGLDTLIAATRAEPYFFLTWFRLGDELFHRGSLVGRARAEAIDAFRECVKQRPDFAPAWEHLAWALALEGDSVGAYVALGTLQDLRKPDDVLALAIHAMVTIGVEWRFASSAEAMRRTDEFLAHPLLKDFPQRAAGPRYLPTFGALRGAVEFGGRYAHDEAHPDLVMSGLIAQMFGYVALGNPDSARRTGHELEERSPTAEYGLFLHELDAALLVLDMPAANLAARWPVVAEGLSEFAGMHTAPEGVRRRAAWAFTLLARRAGSPSDRYAALLAQEPPPQPLRRLLIADSHAQSGHLPQALAASDSLAELTASLLAAHEPVAPFFRAVLHLLRADWYMQLGNRRDAQAELLWHQSLDERGWLTRDPQMAEGDWAFGTLAQWRLAKLLDLAGDQRGALCRAYGEVVRLWSGGEPVYATRADTARARQAALGC